MSIEEEAFNLRRLQKVDQSLKEPGWHSDWEMQAALADDRSRAKVQARNKALQMGVRDDAHPVECSLLRAVVEALSVCYRSSPTRWLARGGERLAEDASEHRAVMAAYERASVDAALAEIDRMRTLFRQVAVRLYPSDLKRRVRLMPYGPMHLLREPDLSEPDDLRADRRFALQHAGGYEMWTRDAEGWSMAMLNTQGQLLPMESQPFAESNLRNPYPELPVVLFYDGLAKGPWIPPKSSRTSYPLMISTLMNSLVSLVRWQAYSEVQYEQPADSARTVTPNEMPSKTGPGLRHLLPPGVTPRMLTHDPRVEECIKVVDVLMDQWLRSESLPTDQFKRSQSVTALGLRTLAQPLQRRQESMRTFALEGERMLYRAFAAVHNVHAGEWGATRLPVDVELEVELGPVEVPTDPRELVDTTAKSMALGGSSVIDLIMAERTLTRTEAIQWYERVVDDREQYPPPGRADVAAPLEAVDDAPGPNLSDPTAEGPQPGRVDCGAVQAAQS